MKYRIVKRTYANHEPVYFVQEEHAYVNPANGPEPIFVWQDTGAHGTSLPDLHKLCYIHYNFQMQSEEEITTWEKL